MSQTTRAQHRFDVLVIGGGPAGMAAAVRAAECGRNVGIVDDNFQLGGQIWRTDSQDTPQSSEATTWTDRLRAAGTTILCGMRVVHQPEPGVLFAEGRNGLHVLAYEKLVLATGAREGFLPFPGWTLQNVIGGGGLQALVKCGLPVAGKRVVVAGTGPLLLAVAAYLRKHGAIIPIICEQASWASLARFAMSLVGQPAKIVQALRLKRELAGVPLAASCWPVSAAGKDFLETVTINRHGKKEVIPCDYLACGFHLIANLELPLLLGCEIRNGFVSVDDFQTTTVPSVFCAGEPTGIGGVELAIVEGQIAGLAAAERTSEAKDFFPERTKLRRFARHLDRAFSLRPELRSLPTSETLICRCEDVQYSRLRRHTSWRDAKLQTRCGMGPCQGRVCGPATEFLFQWKPDSVRPPVFPTRIDSLVDEPGRSQSQLSEIPRVHQ
jgi:D-hydroxyproline dehydrogenase subunit alpha